MFKSGILIMIITLASRVLGLVRTALIAYYFGATKYTDAYFSAFKISNFFRQLLGEGALGTVFIPIYNDREREYGAEKSKSLIYSILNLLFIFTTLITILMVVFSDNIINFIVTGYPEETRLIASRLLKIMAVYFVFIGLAGMISAILNNFKKFLIPASTSLFFNFAIIISIMVYGKQYGVTAMAVGVVVGGLLQFLVVLPAFIKIVKNYEFKVDFKDKDLKKIFLLMIPMLFGIFARQINSIVDQFFASHLASGGVSALENATRIYNLPLGVFGISIATVIYPTLSKAVSNNDTETVRKSLQRGLNFLQFLIIPSMGVLIFYARDIIKLVLGHGEFTQNSITITSESLIYYSVGLFFYTAVHLMSRAFYGMKDTKMPVIFSVISITINIILNAVLIDRFQHKGLALATAIASMVNFMLLYITFNKKYIKLDLAYIVKFKLKVVMSTAIALGGSFYLDNIFIKLITFSGIYLVLWAWPLKKNKLEVF
jgi:putative peptidoglycan lipid II flippase